MGLNEDTALALVITLIQFVSSLIIVGYVILALLALARPPRAQALRNARRRIADGVLLGLSLVVAATLLRTITVHSFAQLGIFAAVFALRTFLKQTFTWEARHL